MLCFFYCDMLCYVFLRYAMFRYLCQIFYSYVFYAILCFVMLCYVMFYYVLFYYVMLCFFTCVKQHYFLIYFVFLSIASYVSLCHALLRSTMPDCVSLDSTILEYFMYFYAVLCFLILCYVSLCYIRQHYLSLCYVFQAILYLTLACPIIPFSKRFTTTKYFLMSKIIEAFHVHQCNCNPCSLPSITNSAHPTWPL